MILAIAAFCAGVVVGFVIVGVLAGAEPAEHPRRNTETNADGDPLGSEGGYGFIRPSATSMKVRDGHVYCEDCEAWREIGVDYCGECIACGWPATDTEADR